MYLVMASSATSRLSNGPSGMRTHRASLLALGPYGRVAGSSHSESSDDDDDGEGDLEHGRRDLINMADCMGEGFECPGAVGVTGRERTLGIVMIVAMQAKSVKKGVKMRRVWPTCT